MVNLTVVFKEEARQLSRDLSLKCFRSTKMIFLKKKNWSPNSYSTDVFKLTDS